MYQVIRPEVKERILRRLKFRGGSAGRNYRGMIKSRPSISRSKQRMQESGGKWGVARKPFQSFISTNKLSFEQNPFMGQLTSGLSPSPIQIRIRAPSSTDSERRILSKYRYLTQLQIYLDTPHYLCEILSRVSYYTLPILKNLFSSAHQLEERC